jgi:hypothetical protein
MGYDDRTEPAIRQYVTKMYGGDEQVGCTESFINDLDEFEDRYRANQ